MSTITRRLPYTNIARLKAINTFKTAYDATPPGTLTLPADIITNLPLMQSDYSTKYYNVEAKEAALTLAQSLEGEDADKLGLIVNHFLQVMRFTVTRSVAFEDGNWAENDIDYYNLDETGGNMPDINTVEDILVWAGHVVNGEAARKTDKPAAPDMTNPTSLEVNALIAPVTARTGAVVAATVALTASRSQLEEQNQDADKFILSSWNFMEANLTSLDAAARRNVLRQYGVVFISTGIPNIIKAHVKHPNGTYLEGAVATIEQTGATATSNSDGLFEISSTALGTLSILITFPGLSNKAVTLLVPDDAEEQVFDLGIIEMTV